MLWRDGCSPTIFPLRPNNRVWRPRIYVRERTTRRNHNPRARRDFWYFECARLHFPQRVVPRSVQRRKQLTVRLGMSPDVLMEAMGKRVLASRRQRMPTAVRIDSALPFRSEAVVHSISGILPSHRSAFFNSAICPAWYTACCVVLWKSR
jgi:hypothetical protein